MRSQLTDANITGIIGTGDWAADYAYHDSGNIASRTIQSSTESFSYNGHLMTNADGNTLDYDENGQLTTDASSRTLIYNHDGKLRKAKDGAATLAYLRYDPLGNRIWKDSSTACTRKYIVDILGDLPVILLELDCDNNIDKTYIYANSQILCQHDGSHTADRYFYLHDRLGSVRKIIDTTGAVAVMYTYEPFGKTIEQDGSFANPFKFSGQFFDSEIDEYYLRARQYDPHISRFTSRDPVFGQFEEPLTLHVYLYCLNDPINRVDPMGLLYLIRGAGNHYDEKETQRVIWRAVSVVGRGYFAGPIQAFGSGDEGPDTFDYKYMMGTLSFTLPKWAGDKQVAANDFGNYLAGYTISLVWGHQAKRFTYGAGNYYAFTEFLFGDRSDKNRTGQILDDPRSQLWIGRGVLDAHYDRVRMLGLKKGIGFRIYERRLKKDLDILEQLVEMSNDTSE